MKVVISTLFASLFLVACENIPDCAYGDSCSRELANLSNADFSNERYKVLTMKNRESLDPYFQVYQVQSPYRYPEGTLVVDTPNRVLYLIEEKGLARRYPIAVGREGYQFEGTAVVGRKTQWPAWYPTPDMLEKNPNLESPVEGGPQNPLGSRAIYLYSDGRDTLYRIHGNNEPLSIGRESSSGCIRMYNEDVIDLYDRVEKNTKVVVIGVDAQEGVEIEHIGTEAETVAEVPMTTWEEIFYGIQNNLGEISDSEDPKTEEEEAETAESTPQET